MASDRMARPPALVEQTASARAERVDLGVAAAPWLVVEQDQPLDAARDRRAHRVLHRRGSA